MEGDGQCRGVGGRGVSDSESEIGTLNGSLGGGTDKGVNRLSGNLPRQRVRHGVGWGDSGWTWEVTVDPQRVPVMVQ